MNLDFFSFIVLITHDNASRINMNRLHFVRAATTLTLGTYSRRIVMKGILTGLLLTVSFASSASTPGLPEQDPVVQDLRSRFAKGSVPDREKLLESSFKCKSFDSRKDKYEIRSFSLSFSAFDGLLHTTTIKPKIYFVNNGYEFIGTSDKGNFLSLRVDTDGNLIGEWTNNKSELVTLDPLAHNIPETQKVKDYILCIIAESN